MEETKQRMLDMLPLYYSESSEVDAIMTANASEIERKRAEARDLLDQFFVRTATWGLADWERVLALAPMPNASIEFRRQRVLSRLNGTAPATVQYLTDLINVHLRDNSTEITEFNNEYRFQAEVGADNDIKTGDIYRSVEEVKPAHLAFGLTVLEKEIVKVRTDAYDFDVTYPITNMFTTADIDGLLTKVQAAITERDYTFNVPYLVTNMFSVQGYRSEIKEGIGMRERTEAIHLTYNRVGGTAVGEDVFTTEVREEEK